MSYIIPKIAPKTISKQPIKSTRSNASNKSSKKAKYLDEAKRDLINKKERDRTSEMNQAFENLKNCLKEISAQKSKIKTLEITNLYIEFLFRMANDDVFFKKYSNYDMHKGFQIYLIEEDALN